MVPRSVLGNRTELVDRIDMCRMVRFNPLANVMGMLQRRKGIQFLDMEGWSQQ